MPDKVSIAVGDQQISDFISYEIDSQLFLAASAFSFEHYNPDLPVTAGRQFRLFVNNSLEHVGIVDKVNPSYDKKGRRFSISGRDMMGLLCDSCCEKYSKQHVLDGKTVKQVVEMLIKDVPFIKREDFKYAWAAQRFDAAYNYEKIDPGETKFEVLKRFASGRGMLFWCGPDGTFTLGKPKDKGNAAFSIICKKSNPSGNNVLTGSMTLDISQSYSSVTVTGQVQGSEKIGTVDGVDISLPAAVNVKATKAMAVPGEFPFYKPLVHRINKDTTSAKREASRLLEQGKAKMISLEYTVPGHSQNGKNWRVNELCHVEDENFTWKGKKLSGDFLIYGRTFTRDKTQSVTKLTLGLPGIILND